MMTFSLLLKLIRTDLYSIFKNLKFLWFLMCEFYLNRLKPVYFAKFRPPFAIDSKFGVLTWHKRVNNLVQIYIIKIRKFNHLAKNFAGNFTWSGGQGAVYESIYWSIPTNLEVPFKRIRICHKFSPKFRF